MAEATTDIPRWASELGEERWERINDLLYDGWDTMDIVRELELPQPKVRSLQLYARKFGPRRRVQLFAEFKDALIGGAAELGPDFVKALRLIAANAVSEEVKESTQRKACELMTEFTKVITKLAAGDEAAEAERQQEERTTDERLDASAVMRQVLDRYGVQFDGGDNG